MEVSIQQVPPHVPVVGVPTNAPGVVVTGHTCWAITALCTDGTTGGAQLDGLTVFSWPHTKDGIFQSEEVKFREAESLVQGHTARM